MWDNILGWMQENPDTLGKAIGTVGGTIAGTYMGQPMMGAQLGGALGGAVGGIWKPEDGEARVWVPPVEGKPGGEGVVTGATINLMNGGTLPLDGSGAVRGQGPFGVQSGAWQGEHLAPAGKGYSRGYRVALHPTAKVPVLVGTLRDPTGKVLDERVVMDLSRASW